MLGVLYKRGRASREAFMAALYRDLAKDEPDEGVVAVLVHRVRRKMAARGIEIPANRGGSGYEMSRANRERLRQLLEAE